MLLPVTIITILIKFLSCPVWEKGKNLGFMLSFMFFMFGFLLSLVPLSVIFGKNASPSSIFFIYGYIFIILIPVILVTIFYYFVGLYEIFSGRREAPNDFLKRLLEHKERTSRQITYED